MLWINAIGWSLVMFLCVYAGLLIFAAYAYCDPLRTQKIAKPDQLFPLFVMETLNTYPGFPGLFICGIFSAGLSVHWCEFFGSHLVCRIRRNSVQKEIN
uniref:Putative potassium/glucose cotransporter n=1 Tax=Panstrongylus lignarius TaxID=156445 RepID=A0A224Y2P0_9HEMI